MKQRGATLIEVLVSAAIAVLIAAGLAASFSSGPAAAASAAAQFDAALAYARALAASTGNGATLVVSQNELRVYAGRPTSDGALTASALAPVEIPGAQVGEATLGPAPLAVFVNGAGHASMAAFSGPTPAPLAQEPACPRGSAWLLTFSDARAQEHRSLPCNVPVGGP